MIKKIKSGLDQRKVRIFLLFLLCSFLIWFVSKLSDTYTSTTTFELIYGNIPDSLSMTEASKKEVNVKLRASGFQFLGFNFHNKNVGIDLSALKRNKENRYFVAQDVYRRQIERQLPKSMTLLEMDSDTLFFNFYSIYTKEIPVRSAITVNPAQNYLLEGKLVLEPDTITVNGPREEIENIDYIKTIERQFNSLTSDFSDKVALDIPENTENTNFSASSVTVSGKVFRFSEKVIKVPVTVINLPEGTEIKTFPNTIGILCKGRIERLKDLTPSDFKLVADFGSLKKKRGKNLEVRLKKVPKDIHSTKLLETQVEYILKRK